ncbi:MAG: hypothetical protein RIS38_927 [Verrucomicrobiota bacterium]|jgi:hypothetical protein
MSASSQFRLRWKGAVSGPHSAQRIGEMLRAGEISLLHGIEVDGSWLTVRDHLRASGQSRGPLHSAGESNGERREGSPSSGDLRPGDTPVATGDRAHHEAGESLERTVREGYLWCGSTFLLPPLFALGVYAWQLLAPETSPISLYILLVFTTSLGAFLPVHFVRKAGHLLDREGLGEIRQTQAGLAWALASLGCVLWLWCFWILVHPRP